MVVDTKKDIVDKIGVKPGMTVFFFHAPETYIAQYKKLWNIITVVANLDERVDMIHAFFLNLVELRDSVDMLKDHVKKDGMLWISWPKKSSRVKTDLSDNIVRDWVLSTEFVDIKVAAIDETWSGLKFVHRKEMK